MEFLLVLVLLALIIILVVFMLYKINGNTDVSSTTEVIQEERKRDPDSELKVDESTGESYIERVTSDRSVHAPFLLKLARIVEFNFHWSGDYIIIDKNKKTISTKNLNIRFDELEDVTLRDDQWISQRNSRVDTKADPIDIMLGMPNRRLTSSVTNGSIVSHHDYYIDIKATKNRKDTIKASRESINAKNAIEVLETIILGNTEAKSEEETQPQIHNSKADEIKKLKELLDSGAIDQTEFETMKKEVILG